MGTILDESSGKLNIAPLTVDQYEAMIAQGILPEGSPFELLDGLIVQKDRAERGMSPMTVGTKHQQAIKKILRRLRGVENLGCHLAGPGPIRIPPGNEPDPDIAVVRGDPDDYADHHPGPEAIPCVIEVADSSLRIDRTSKARIYATAGVPQYLLVNLVDEQVEVHDRPRDGEYKGKRIARRATLVKVSVGAKSIGVAARDLLP